MQIFPIASSLDGTLIWCCEDDAISSSGLTLGGSVFPGPISASQNDCDTDPASDQTAKLWVHGDCCGDLSYAALELGAGVGMGLVMPPISGDLEISGDVIVDDIQVAALLTVMLADNANAAIYLTPTYTCGDNSDVQSMSLSHGRLSLPDIADCLTICTIYGADCLSIALTIDPTLGCLDTAYAYFSMNGLGHGLQLPQLLDGACLPSSDPAVSGQVWNNAGVLTVSTGGS